MSFVIRLLPGLLLERRRMRGDAAFLIYAPKADRGLGALLRTADQVIWRYGARPAASAIRPRPRRSVQMTMADVSTGATPVGQYDRFDSAVTDNMRFHAVCLTTKEPVDYHQSLWADSLARTRRRLRKMECDPGVCVVSGVPEKYRAANKVSPGRC